MNKKIAEYCASHNLKVTKNNAYGITNNYETNLIVRILDNVAPVTVHFSCYTNFEQQKAILNSIRDEKIKSATYGFDVYGLWVGLNDITVGKLMARMSTIMNIITASLYANEAKGIGYCPVCGDEINEENSKVYDIDGCNITLDEKCVQNINAVIHQENKDFEKAPNNYLKGFLGALIGAIVGVVSFIIIFYLGFISAISAFVSIFLGAFLYKKLGGKPNKGMILIVTSVSIVSLLLTVFIIYLLAAIGLASSYGFDSTGLAAFANMMTIRDFKAEFTSNMLMTALFTLLGSGYEVYALYKSIKREQTISK